MDTAAAITTVALVTTTLSLLKGLPFELLTEILTYIGDQRAITACASRVSRAFYHAVCHNYDLQRRLCDAGLCDGKMYSNRHRMRKNAHTMDMWLFNAETDKSLSLYIGKDFRLNPNLHVLRLRQCIFGPLSANVIAKMIETTTTLHTLYLDTNRFNGVSIMRLLDAVESNTTITSLRITESKMPVECAERMVSIVERSTHLREVNFTQYRMGPELCSRLATAMLTNTCVRSLCLYGNEMREAGIMWGDVLEQNTTLQYLNLRYNEIGDVAGERIAEALKRNTTLHKINLDDNDIERETYWKIDQKRLE